jgi:hypothetical protein
LLSTTVGVGGASSDLLQENNAAMVAISSICFFMIKRGFDNYEIIGLDKRGFIKRRSEKFLRGGTIKVVNG